MTQAALWSDERPVVDHRGRTGVLIGFLATDEGVTAWAKVRYRDGNWFVRPRLLRNAER